MSDKAYIWAFDLGKASIGEAVRIGNTFPHKASLLLPQDFAETKSATKRRRFWRTRLAHKQREEWLREVMAKAGIEGLRGRRTEWNEPEKKWRTTLGDPRLEREFATHGDPTCYTSCLLRIKLLRGEELEPWQVYKAFHSAIQRRGYDPDIPWKARSQRRAKPANADEEEAGTRARMEEYVKLLEAMAPGQPRFQLPCYYDAWKMGLWDPQRPDELKPRLDCHALSTRNQIVPRKLVEQEIRLLVEGAARHYPALKGEADYLLYGPAKEPYASYFPALRKQYGLKEGGATDWQGVLGQKIPRFDNRIIEKCVLIPRLNVCKIRTDKKGELHPQSRLPAEVTFLMKLKNMQIQRGGKQTGLTAAEISAIFENPAFQNLAITESAWKKKVCVPLLAVPLPGNETVEAPKGSGRSRFCRPALNILKRLILSGQNPREFQQAEVVALNGNTNPLKGLVVSDLDFLLRMGETWEGIYIPNQKLEALARNAPDPQEAIRTLIGSQNDPIVRHRLNLFVERLDHLQQRFGTPDSVVLEFVREDFMGAKARLEYNRFLKERTAQRAQAKKEAIEAGATEAAAGFKLELLKAQQGICLYTGEGLVPTELDLYVIDHIVPRAKGGPDSVLNYVLTTRRTNDDKGERTPYQWLSGTSGWDAYVNRVRERATTLRHKKAQLLISPEAETLVQKYTALAETAWISKLAQAILDLRFGWRNGNDPQGRKRVTIVSGGLTGRIRRKHGLNRILNPTAQDEEEAEKKNRSDARHHALDAMVISYIPGWARDITKTGFFKFPDGVNRELFEREIKEVVPQNVCLEKAAFEETFYGARTLHGERFIVGREELASLAVKIVGNRRVLKPLKDIELHRIVDKRVRRDVHAFLESHAALTLDLWDSWCAAYRLGSSGPKVQKLLVTKTKADSVEEYRDVSKDSSGQFRRGAKHRGYFVYERPSPTKGNPGNRQVEVRPVYVFESKRQVQKDLACREGVRVIGYFESGCLVQTRAAWSFRGTSYPATDYICTSIWTNRNAKLKHPQFGEIGPVGLRILLDAGFKRVGAL